MVSNYFRIKVEGEGEYKFFTKEKNFEEFYYPLKNRGFELDIESLEFYDSGLVEELELGVDLEADNIFLIFEDRIDGGGLFYYFLYAYNTEEGLGYDLIAPPYYEINDINNPSFPTVVDYLEDKEKDDLNGYGVSVIDGPNEFLFFYSRNRKEAEEAFNVNYSAYNKLRLYRIKPNIGAGNYSIKVRKY